MSARTLRTTHARVTPSQLCITTTNVQALPPRKSVPSYSPIRATSLVLLTHERDALHCLISLPQGASDRLPPSISERPQAGLTGTASPGIGLGPTACLGS